MTKRGRKGKKKETPKGKWCRDIDTKGASGKESEK